MYLVLKEREKKKKIRRKSINFVRSKKREKKYLRFASCQSITSGWRHVLNARMRSMFVKDDINLSIHVWRYIYETRIRHEAWWMMAGERKRPFSRISFFFSPFPDSLSFCVSLSIACLSSIVFFLQFRLSLYRCSPKSFSPNCMIYIYKTRTERYSSNR